MSTKTPRAFSKPPYSDRLTGDPSILQAALVFLRHAAPRTWLALAALTVTIRLAVGGWSVWDVVLVTAMVIVQPFVEWVIHVFILHFKPVKVLGKKFDLYAARLHRAHHRAPWKLELIFVPMRTGLLGLALGVVAWRMVLPTTPLFATAIAWTMLSLLTYEWIHFLTHTNFRPRTRFYRRLWRLHRLHHFKNERYWQGVTGHLGDRVLGTMADPSGVQLSPTCRTLGVDG